MKIKGKTPLKTFSVTVPADLLPFIKARVAEKELTISTYFRLLAKADLIELKKSGE